MPTRRALGTLTLSALGIAAVSFAIVDVSTSAASPCIEPAADCAHAAAPVAAVAFTILGFVGILAGLIPGTAWAARVLSHHREEQEQDEAADREAARALRPSSPRELDEDDSGAATSRISGRAATGELRDGPSSAPRARPRRTPPSGPGRPPR
ncbi:hypothetical protein [Homoserinibacter sp. YIM 151385]|uniref:hypothetical protein n=1 Tax=Homoserinibacter sp. YIM 151385 TaxID=2985506 RepID=UPI0022EFDE78|nr:hypothetical protein [Homoserinibacter sp. YIM 151385]WBU38382.1 hypothetical protein OF852_02005 [Homoserinibacter sp. YIM 151385]